MMHTPFNRLYLGIGFNRIAYYSLHVHLFKGNMMHVGQWVECILQFVHLWTGRWGWRFLRYHSIQGCQIVYLKRLSSPHYLRDAYFTLFVDIHPGKVFTFYSFYLTNWEELPFFGHFYPGRVYNFLENIHPWSRALTAPAT